MASAYNSYTYQNSSSSASTSSHRSVAMILADVIGAVVLSPLYSVNWKKETTPYYETKWSSGLRIID
ncbi:hypothetical protein G4B88_022440 [Cannabis sativa]|uniref:Uncharacterized protein n=1 Tax=Cannabis sativa TaxID=3483 RepID=A0A7J6HVL9_CANSA|nr:hypothetical protein G4B88_022440 [Cannabis sativa]